MTPNRPQTLINTGSSVFEIGSETGVYRASVPELSFFWAGKNYPLKGCHQEVTTSPLSSYGGQGFWENWEYNPKSTRERKIPTPPPRQRHVLPA